MRVLVPFFLIAAAVAGMIAPASIAGFGWPEPDEVNGYFGRETDSGRLLRGVLREPLTEMLPVPDDQLLFRAEVESGNSLFSGEVQVTSHDRDFMLLQVLLPQGHYAALLDSRLAAWVNPELLLPLTMNPEGEVRIVLSDEDFDDPYLHTIELEIGVWMGTAENRQLRPVQSFTVFVDGVEVLHRDYTTAEHRHPDDVDVRFRDGRYIIYGIPDGGLLRVLAYTHGGNAVDRRFPLDSR